MPVGSQYTFEATITLPVEIDESFLIPDVPVFGDVNASLTGAGEAVSRQQFTITLMEGDYNGDLLLDCEDLGLLEDVVAAGSENLAFDANADGMLDGDDLVHWLGEIRNALPGDANLDDAVDAGDFDIWNQHKFTMGGGWCAADFDLNGSVDGFDLLIWNEHKFTSTNSIPEPGWLSWTFLVLLPMGRRRRADLAA